MNSPPAQFNQLIIWLFHIDKNLKYISYSHCMILWIGFTLTWTFLKTWFAKYFRIAAVGQPHQSMKKLLLDP